MFKACAETPHGHDTRFQRINFARHQSLQRIDNLRPNDNWVSSHMRRRAMRANTSDSDINTVHIGQRVSRSIADFARWRPARCMGRKNIIWAWEFLEKTVFKHRLCTQTNFFCGLTDED